MLWTFLDKEPKTETVESNNRDAKNATGPPIHLSKGKFHQNKSNELHSMSVLFSGFVQFSAFGLVNVYKNFIVEKEFMFSTNLAQFIFMVFFRCMVFPLCSFPSSPSASHFHSFYIFILHRIICVCVCVQIYHLVCDCLSHQLIFCTDIERIHKKRISVLRFHSHYVSVSDIMLFLSTPSFFSRMCIFSPYQKKN